MPTKLPNGLLLYNATAHDMFFECGEEVVLVPQDGIINAKIEDTVVEEHLIYKLLTNRYLPLQSGLLAIESIRKNYGEILIVGSQIAAQAYKGEIVYPLPITKSRKESSKVNKLDRVNRSDKFVTFRKVSQSGKS